MNKLWLKSGGFSDNSIVSDGDHEALHGCPIPHTRCFDVQAGVRADLDSGPKRAWSAIGIEGQAPYFFQFAATIYISATAATLRAP
jgi:copper resistance protein B